MRYLIFIFLFSFGLSSFGSTLSFHGVNVLTDKPAQILFPSEKMASVLVFLSASCPCSASHEDLLKELSDKYPEIAFYAIHSNADESLDSAKQHFTTASLPFPVLRDKKTQIADKLGALKTPHVFVFDKDGKQLYHGGVTNSHVGKLATKNFLAEVLQDLREGKPVRHKEGRALGCYIMRG